MAPGSDSKSRSKKKRDKSKSKKSKGSKGSSKSKSKDKKSSKSKDKKSKKSSSKDKKSKKSSKSKGGSKKSSKESKSKKGSKSKSRKSSKDKDEQKPPIEIVKAPQLIQKIPGVSLPKLCAQYNEPLMLYCETCEEPICEKSTILGPHNTQLHRITSLQDAYRVRVAKMSQILNSSLLVKRDNIIAQIHRLDYRMEEVKFVRTVIERDARSEYGGIIERLKSSEGQKLAILQHEMAELQKDIDRINDINQQFSTLTRSQDDIVDFLLRSRVLSENIEYISAKPFKVQIQVIPYDLPRELKEKREQLRKFKIHQELLDFKDNCIWKIYQEKKCIEDKAVEDLEKATIVEIQEWSRLVDNFNNELQKFQLVCFYCGQPLNQKTVNELCEKNTEKKLPEKFQGFTTKAPEISYHGTNRHNFGPPDNELIQKLMYKDKKDKNMYLTPLTRYIDVQLHKLRQVISTQGLDLAKMLKNHDKEDTGYITSLEFQYLLKQNCNFNEEQYMSLSKFLDPNDENKVNYRELLKLLKDKEYIKQIEERGMDYILENQHKVQKPQYQRRYTPERTNNFASPYH